MIHEAAGQVLAAGIGDVINGVAPSWGPFGALGTQAKVVIDVVMAAALVVCIGIAAWGASKQRVGSSSRNSMHAEEGKGLIVSGIAGAFIIGSLGTIFTIVYGLAI